MASDPAREQAKTSPLTSSRGASSPPPMLWKSVSTQNVRHDRREPPPITPPKNPRSVSIAQVAATFLNAEIAFPIPPARAWVCEEHVCIQQSSCACCALRRNPLLSKPVMQLTFQSLALCALPRHLILHAHTSKTWIQLRNRKQVPTPDVERRHRTIREMQSVLLPDRVFTSHPKCNNPVPTS